MDLREQIAALSAITVDLDGYLERRAAELAQPLIDKAYNEAARRFSEAEFEVTRQTDLVKELRRQLAPAARYADLCKERAEKAEATIAHMRGAVTSLIDEWEACIGAGTGVGADWEQCLFANLPSLRAVLTEPAPAQTTAPKRRTEQDGGIPNDALTPGDPIQRGI